MATRMSSDLKKKTMTFREMLEQNAIACKDFMKCCAYCEFPCGNEPWIRLEAAKKAVEDAKYCHHKNAEENLERIQQLEIRGFYEQSNCMAKIYKLPCKCVLDDESYSSPFLIIGMENERIGGWDDETQIIIRKICLQCLHGGQLRFERLKRETES